MHFINLSGYLAASVQTKPVNQLTDCDEAINRTVNTSVKCNKINMWRYHTINYKNNTSQILHCDKSLQILVYDN